jgi:hypothetical protein
MVMEPTADVFQAKQQGGRIIGTIQATLRLYSITASTGGRESFTITGAMPIGPIERGLPIEVR